ncbi:thymidylate synthase [Brevundimonas sp. LM2]|uniref:thymidylate synthase n=1 Tax=Brevundimonas sp. LM2 TaxID=1938605 RepID=UPI000983DE90|nr:thymidylate synthase [Brevundimonas sp. LM2]AQR60265.1 thymidylate synthase [Brevundimonas sp. LM2]
MECSGDSLDDVLIQLYNALGKTTRRNEEGSRGSNFEILGVSLHVSNPRARLSRSENRGKTFSALGELLWYLSGREDLGFIEPYVPIYRDEVVNGIIEGAYGPRLFDMRGINQIDSIISILSRKPGTRRAVIQLFNAEDIAIDKKEIPCTTTLQFHLREDGLHLSVTMRSNDAYWGLPHDVFCFTMMQELIARRLNVELGTYMHYAGSMHVYDNFYDDMKSYVSEGYQRPAPMPEMPIGDNFALVPAILAAEDSIRHGEPIGAALQSNAYWKDIIILVEAYWASGQPEKLDKLKEQLHEPMYFPYIDARKTMAVRAPLKRQ